MGGALEILFVVLYVVDGGSAFCTFLDATKAFDQVDYCKLLRALLKCANVCMFLFFSLFFFACNFVRTSY